MPIPSMGQNRLDLDDDADILFEESPLPAVETKAGAPVSPLGLVLSDAVWTLGYEFSYGADRDSGIIENAGYLRCETDTLFRENIFLKFDGKAHVMPASDHRADARDKALLLDGTIRQAYLEAGYDDFSLSLGNRVLVWGQADTAAVTDVLSPRDTSRFIFVKLEDARFGQFMATGHFYTGPGDIFLFVSPRPETNKEPADRSRYFRALPGAAGFSVKDDPPEFGDLEFGAKWSGTLAATDISIMAGHFFANDPVYETGEMLDDGRRVVIKGYPSFNMAGAALSLARGSFLYKAEIAYKHGMALQAFDSSESYGTYFSEKTNLLDSGIGIEYNANDRYQMTIELTNRHLFSALTAPVFDRRTDSTALYYTFFKEFLNQTLSVEYSFYHHLTTKDRFHRFELTCDPFDSAEITLDYTRIHATDPYSLMWPYRGEDRIGVEIKYFF